MWLRGVATGKVPSNYDNNETFTGKQVIIGIAVRKHTQHIWGTQQPQNRQNNFIFRSGTWLHAKRQIAGNPTIMLACKHVMRARCDVCDDCNSMTWTRCIKTSYSHQPWVLLNRTFDAAAWHSLSYIRNTQIKKVCLRLKEANEIFIVSCHFYLPMSNESLFGLLKLSQHTQTVRFYDSQTRIASICTAPLVD